MPAFVVCLPSTRFRGRWGCYNLSVALHSEETDIMDDRKPLSIEARIKQIVSWVSRIDESEFEDQVLIREELGIDSLMGMEIIANCEKAFNIRIDESLFASIATVGDFLRIVRDLCDEKHQY